MTRHARTSHPHRRAARAMTLLEVLLAVLLLSLTIGGVMAAVSSIGAMEATGRKRLAAYEVANRLMLTYLDDDRSLPALGRPITYGHHRFFWDLDETGATMAINRRQESSGANLQALDRYNLVGVTVYECRGEEGSEIKGEPIAFLSRVIDPAAARSPDSMQTFSDVERVERVERLVRIATGTQARRESASSVGGRRLK